MTTRVLSSDEAKQAISDMAGIVNGTLMHELEALNSRGLTLSDANVWDGKLASEFRDSTWPATKSALDNMRTQLDELRAKIEGINTDIMTAGGNA